MRSNWIQMLNGLRHQLQLQGIDLCQVFSVQRYNHLVNDTTYHLPVSGTSRYAMLLGNTRQFWSPFCRWLERQCTEKTIEQEEHVTTHWHLVHHHPVDTYVQQVIHKALVASNIPYLSTTDNSSINETSFGVKDIRYAHETEQGRLLPIQTVAHAAGLGYYLKSIGLCSHPVYGPWIAFRAVVLFDGIDPTDDIDDIPNDYLPCPFSNEQQEALVNLLHGILRRQQQRQPASMHRSTLSDSIDDVINELLGASSSSSVIDQETRDWIHQVCQRGRLIKKTSDNSNASPRLDWLILRLFAANMLNIDATHRYTVDQAAYHYGKQLDLLEQIVNERKR